MTPQERQLVDDLFDRLARLDKAPRDAEAERAIADGLRRAPNALYALVQSVLVQDEALRRADARIRELGGEEAVPAGGFLDTMRTLLGGGSPATSVPSVRAGVAREAEARYAAPPAAAPAAAAPGGSSFLGTAAASAAGVIGGALLLNSISSLISPSPAHAAVPPNAANDATAQGGGAQGGGNDVSDASATDADFADLGSDLGDGGGFDT